MEKKLEIFKNEEFGEIRTLTIDNKPYFCASDIAKALGYAKPHNAISTHCRYTLKQGIATKQGNMCEMTFIPEGDVYRLIVKSKLPSAEKFESWVMDDVLPTIRKTGGYVNDDKAFINTYLPFADDQTKLLFSTTLEVIRRQNKQIEEQKPLVDFANKVSISSNLIDMGKMAKLLKDKDINIGRNKLFSWLRQQGILMKNNIPYQRYIDAGYFEVKESTYQTSDGVKTQQTTFVTGKGQVYIAEKLKKFYSE